MSRPSLDLLIDKKDLVGVEIGVQGGTNAKWMLENLDIQKLYLVDPYGKFRCNNGKPLEDGGLYPATPKAKTACRKNLKKWKDKIQYVYKYSFDAINYFEKRSMDFIYIDGDHRREALLKDLEYITKVKLGGLLCGHDWRFESVQRAINEFVLDRRLPFECCGSTQYIKIIDKNTKGSDWWIHIPITKDKFSQKCDLCQRVHTYKITDVKWLN